MVMIVHGDGVGFDTVAMDTRIVIRLSLSRIQRSGF